MKIGIIYTFKDIVPGGGEKYLFTTAEILSRKHEVYLLSHKNWDFISVARKINVNLDKVHFQILPYGRIKRILSGLFNKEYDLFISMTNHIYPYLFSQGKKGILHIQFPFLKNFERWPVLNISSKVLSFFMIRSYDKIICNSLFTKRWIEKRCKRKLPIDILYPPCDVDYFTLGRKENWILSVGRYFVGWHNKKQLEMVEIFKKMVDEGLEGWEYHQVGSTLPGEEHQEYLKQIKERSEGYPVYIHTDVSLEEMRVLYSTSKVYWHATGLGEDDEKYPERMEHFGISTVEAMAAGCVPVVINKGGQPEIVNHTTNGLLWETDNELLQYTQKLIENVYPIEKLSLEAIKRAKTFSKKNFEKRFFKILAELEV